MWSPPDMAPGPNIAYHLEILESDINTLHVHMDLQPGKLKLANVQQVHVGLFTSLLPHSCVCFWKSLPILKFNAWTFHDTVLACSSLLELTSGQLLGISTPACPIPPKHNNVTHDIMAFEQKVI